MENVTSTLNLHSKHSEIWVCFIVKSVSYLTLTQNRWHPARAELQLERPCLLFSLVAVSSGWLLQWVSSGEWRCCCEKASSRCTYTCKRENESLRLCSMTGNQGKLALVSHVPVLHPCSLFGCLPKSSCVSFQMVPWGRSLSQHPSFVIKKPCVPHTIYAS